MFTNPGDRLMGIVAIGDAGLSTADAQAGMVYMPGGTFRMGSDKHYPDEAPVDRVTVDNSWIDRTPVTNRELRC
jgi:sulfatase modifying factor 1